MRRGVEDGHAGDVVEYRTDDRQPEIDQADRGCHLGGARQDLLRQIRGFGAHQLHAADPQHRQDRDGHDDEADAAEPMEDGAPQENARWRDVQADDHGRTGRRDARDRFEHGLGRAQVELAERERQRGERPDHDPHRAGQEKGLAAGQLGIPVALVHQDQGHPGEQRDRARRQEYLPVGMSDRHVGDHRRRHEQGQDDQQSPDHDQDRPQVESDAPGDGQRCGGGHQTSV